MNLRNLVPLALSGFVVLQHEGVSQNPTHNFRLKKTKLFGFGVLEYYALDVLSSIDPLITGIKCGRSSSLEYSNISPHPTRYPTLLDVKYQMRRPSCSGLMYLHANYT